MFFFAQTIDARRAAEAAEEDTGTSADGAGGELDLESIVDLGRVDDAAAANVVDISNLEVIDLTNDPIAAVLGGGLANTDHDNSKRPAAEDDGDGAKKPCIEIRASPEVTTQGEAPMVTARQMSINTDVVLEPVSPAAWDGIEPISPAPWDGIEPVSPAASDEEIFFDQMSRQMIVSRKRGRDDSDDGSREHSAKRICGWHNQEYTETHNITLQEQQPAYMAATGDTDIVFENVSP